MNPIDFFNANFARHAGVMPGNDPVGTAERAITKSHDIGGKPLRLTHVFIVVQDGKAPHTNAKMNPDLFTVEPKGRSAFQVFHDYLATWDGVPKMLIHIPGKRGMLAREFSLTHDPRVTRICTPTGIITFDFTAPPSLLATKTELIIKAIRSKTQ